MVRSYQPDILINDRLEGSGAEVTNLVEGNLKPWSGDFASPEKIIPHKGVTNKLGKVIPWESCITMNNYWSYYSGDTYFKNANIIVRSLVECVSKNGNLLLNIGPDARGNIPIESMNILNKVGDWMKLNNTSIYNCESSGLEKPDWGRYTRSGNKIFAHVYEPPIGPLMIPGIGSDQIKNIRLLRYGTELNISKEWMTSTYDDGQTFINISPISHGCMLPDIIDTVIEIELIE